MGLAGVELGDTLFALDVGEVGVDSAEQGNVLKLTYDVGSNMLCVVMQFNLACVNITAD